jgi:uncharacterized protein YecE (DUF72 family)
MAQARAAGRIRVGISGWRYPPWRGVFYPRGLPQRCELAYAASRLSTVEINGSFYSLQRPEYYREWAGQVPQDFEFAVKGGRFITHMKRLDRVELPLANFLASGVLALGPALGPLLWQLPPTLAPDLDRLDRFLTLLPRTTADAARTAAGHDEKVEGRALTAALADAPLEHALEVRHRAFAEPDVRSALVALLRRQRVALVVADTGGRFPALDDVTAGHVYVRLHGAEELYASGYDDAALDHWAGLVRGWADGGLDVRVYFDNDIKVRAPFDAMALADRLGVTPVAVDPAPGRESPGPAGPDPAQRPARRRTPGRR